MDAVLSIRANYGQPHNGVRGAVASWREERGGSKLDDLNALATFDLQRLAVVINNQQRLSGGSLKVEAIVEAAQNLLDLGVRRAADLSEPSAEHKHAYRSVNGLGPVTWDYFLMLLGSPGIKADTWKPALGARPKGGSASLLAESCHRTSATRSRTRSLKEGFASESELGHLSWVSTRRSVAPMGEGTAAPPLAQVNWSRPLGLVAQGGTCGW